MCYLGRYLGTNKVPQDVVGATCCWVKISAEYYGARCLIALERLFIISLLVAYGVLPMTPLSDGRFQSQQYISG